MELKDITGIPKWPQIGAKLKYRGSHHFWFTNILQDVKMLQESGLLVYGNEYTLAKIEVFSSWVRIKLEEFPNKDFPLSFFDYET